jgi:hypothetical protein
MFIEFQLPKEISTRIMANAIKAEVAVWASRYGVPDSDYSQKTIKYTHRLGFNKEKHFSLFSITWNKFDYRIVSIENERY